jgi:hypothetical protein
VAEIGRRQIGPRHRVLLMSERTSAEHSEHGLDVGVWSQPSMWLVGALLGLTSAMIPWGERFGGMLAHVGGQHFDHLRMVLHGVSGDAL